MSLRKYVQKIKISSVTGNRTRVSRVRAVYPNRLDYNGMVTVPAQPSLINNSVVEQCKNDQKLILQCNYMVLTNRQYDIDSVLIQILRT